MRLVKSGVIMSLVSVFALLTAIVAALGQLGRWSDRFDAINIVLPYLVMPALMAAALVLIADRGRRGLASWLCGGAALLLIAGPLPRLLGEWRVRDTAACKGVFLRIVQFNLWKDNRDTVSAARWIRRVDPDLVLIEEAHNTVPMTMLLRDQYPFQQSCVGPSACSTLILAKRQPLASGGLARADPENRGALSAAWMRVDTVGGPFTVVAVHLGRPWPFLRFAKDRAELVRYVRSQSQATTLVAGDFNLPGWTFQLSRLEVDMGLERRSRALPSWPAIIRGQHNPLPLLPIDHLFAGHDWTVVGMHRGPFLGSDHYPLVVDLRRCARRRS